MRVFLLLSAVVLLAGCGGGGSDVDLTVFEGPINSYLDNGNMDMKVKSVKEAAVTDKTAKVKASLVLKEEDTASLAVRWTFDCEQDDKGAWKVVSHIDK
jgi:hypothetical protein